MMTTENDQIRHAEPHTSHSTAQAALRGQRRWRLTFASCSALLWLLVAAVVLGAALFLVTYIVPIWVHIADQAAEGADIAKQDIERLAFTMVVTARVFYFGSLIMAVSLLLAVCTTIFYIRTSHRISLTRLQSELADISDQLRALHAHST